MCVYSLHGPDAPAQGSVDLPGDPGLAVATTPVYGQATIAGSGPGSVPHAGPALRFRDAQGRASDVHLLLQIPRMVVFLRLCAISPRRVRHRDRAAAQAADCSSSGDQGQPGRRQGLAAAWPVRHLSDATGEQSDGSADGLHLLLPLRAQLRPAVFAMSCHALAHRHRVSETYRGLIHVQSTSDACPPSPCASSPEAPSCREDRPSGASASMRKCARTL